MNAENQPDHKLRLRNLRSSDYQDIREIMERVYRALGEYWSEAEYASHLARFPQGQICIEDHGKVVAAALSLIIDFSKYGENHTYYQVIGEGRLKKHDPESDPPVLENSRFCAA